jgi:hypothetical protein
MREAQTITTEITDAFPARSRRWTFATALAPMLVAFGIGGGQVTLAAHHAAPSTRPAGPHIVSLGGLSAARAELRQPDAVALVRSGR